MAFSDTKLKSLKPKDKPYRVFEKATTKGFGVQVTSKGSVSFFVCYQSEGKVRYKTLGNYPGLSISEARALADAFRLKLEQGEVKRAGLMEDLCEAYVNYLKQAGKTSHAEVSRSFNVYVLPLIGSKQANNVTTDDIKRVVKTCLDRGANVQAERVRSYLKSAFKYGLSFDNDPRHIDRPLAFNLVNNPVDVLPRMGEFETVGSRVLTKEELRHIWHDEQNVLSLQHKLVLRILIITGFRVREVTGAAVSEIDLESDLWTLPPDRNKGRRFFSMPLTPLLKEQVQEALDVCMSPYLFPNKNDPQRAEHKTSFDHAVKRFTDMQPWTPRDLRRTWKTWTGHAGLDKDIRDRLQNHALNDVATKHYDRYLYLEEKREAMLRWEDWLRQNTVAGVD